MFYPRCERKEDPNFKAMSQFKKLESIDNQLISIDGKTSGGTFDFQTGNTDVGRLQHASLNRNTAFANNDFFLIKNSGTSTVPSANMTTDKTFYLYSTDNGEAATVEVEGRKLDGTYTKEVISMTGNTTVPLTQQFTYFIKARLLGKSAGTLTVSTEDDQAVGVSNDPDNDVGTMRQAFHQCDSVSFQCLPTEKISMQNLRVYHEAANDMVVSLSVREATNTAGGRYLEFVCPTAVTSTFDISLIPSFQSIDAGAYTQVWVSAREEGGPTALPKFQCEVAAIISP